MPTLTNRPRLTSAQFLGAQGGDALAVFRYKGKAPVIDLAACTKAAQHDEGHVEIGDLEVQRIQMRRWFGGLLVDHGRQARF